MNLVFISGPHGAGKTTLVNNLAEDSKVIHVPELMTKTPKFHTEPFERMILKIYQRCIENYEAREIAKKMPDKIVIGNRCIYDTQCYAEAYHRLGWISNEEKASIDRLTKDAYFEYFQAPTAIVLNPPIEVLKEHLKERWCKGEKKYREDDMDYLRAAAEAYTEAYLMQDRPQVLYITDNGSRERAWIREWLLANCNINREHTNHYNNQILDHTSGAVA
jgi:deoxyadenosine/deoxycytidine kinase